MATKIVDVRQGGGQKASLPPMTKTFNISYTDENEKTYGGDFTVKRMNMGDVRKIAVRKAQLNGGLPEDALDDTGRYLNSIMAHLEVVLVKTPEWWTPDEFYGSEVIASVYEEVAKFEASFRGAAQRGPEEDQEHSEVEPEHRSGASAQMVDKEVPASADL